MERARELALGDRLADLERLAFGQHEQPTVVDTSVYTDPDRHRRELAALGRYPQVVAHSSDLPGPGDFVTTDVAGLPLIVQRDRDGAVHALVNACAHRGSTVQPEACGSARLHSCPFHGWSYHLDGRLRSVSEPDRYGDAPAVEGLRRLATVERHGVIWATTGVDSQDQAADAAAFDTWLGAGEPGSKEEGSKEEGGMDTLLGDLGLASMVAHTSTTYDLACNWKMLTDGFLETYHLKYLHRGTIAPYFPSNRTIVDRYGPHFAAMLPKNRLLELLAEKPRDDWAVLDHLTMAITLVPGTVIQWQAGHVELFALRPDLADPTRCRVQVSMLVPGDRASDAELWDRNWERLLATIPAEDFAAAEDVQANIDAGLVPQLRLGATEHALVEHLAAVDALTGPVSG